VVDTFIPISALPEVSASAANYRSTVPDWMRSAVTGQAATPTQEAVSSAKAASAADIAPAASSETMEPVMAACKAEKAVKCEGVVLEFDGPTHFESYMHVSSALQTLTSTLNCAYCAPFLVGWFTAHSFCLHIDRESWAPR
jgi:hypothetical protein